MKMTFSPASEYTWPLETNRQIYKLTSDRWSWPTAVPAFTLTFGDMPDERDALNFYLLMQLGRGDFGTAWLAATEKGGMACVIKVLHDEREEAVEKLKTEARNWEKIWDAKGIRVLTLAKKPALVMPFVRTCVGTVDNQDGQKKSLAKEAIDRIVSCGYVHKDLGWRHVGLCRQS